MPSLRAECDGHVHQFRQRASHHLSHHPAPDAHTPPELDRHLVLDNSSSHKTPLIHRWLVRHPPVHLHFTPTSASRGAFRSTWALEQAIKNDIAVTNAEPKPFVWTKTADEILESVARYCRRTTDSHH